MANENPWSALQEIVESLSDEGLEPPRELTELFAAFRRLVDRRPSSDGDALALLSDLDPTVQEQAVRAYALFIKADR